MFHRLRVATVERLCEDAVVVGFDVPDELRATFAFRAGQYLTLRRRVDGGREERRSYSICAPEGQAPRIGVRRVDTGLFSEWLVDGLAPGGEVEVAPPDGRFTPDIVPGSHHALIAAGSGITPVLSIAATALAAHPDTRITLIYGNRRSDTVMFTEALSDLKNVYGPRLALAHVLSREPMATEIFTGRLDAGKLRALLPGLVPVPEVDHWWLCGPLGMTEDAGQVLGELGVDRQRVHRELFYVDAPPPEPARGDDAPAGQGQTSEVTIILDGRSTRLSLPRTVPLLDAAQRTRSDLPFACKGGCAAPAAPGSPTARWRCGATSPSRTTSSRPGSC